MISLPWQSSEEDCREEEEEDTGEEFLEEFGKGEECLESDKLSSSPESLEIIVSDFLLRDLRAVGVGASLLNLW